MHAPFRPLTRPGFSPARPRGYPARRMPLDAQTYAVAERLRAGTYPVALGQAGGAPPPHELEHWGVTLFVDLTIAGELEPYAHALTLARHVRRPIPDMSVTTPAEMQATLDLIDAELAGGGGVYVHCWGGVGRTGTVVGCWLRRHALDDGDAVARIALLRGGVRNAWMDSPQTDAQRQMVLGGRAARRGSVAREPRRRRAAATPQSSSR